MSSEKTKVSVCIPNYNYGRFIRDAIQSVLDQTYKDFELIIVDNCSTDNSEEVIKSFSDPRIRFYKNEKNIGFVKNLNKCLSLASGEYISILHSDDMYLPNMLEKEAKILDSNPNVGFVYSSVKIINKDGIVTEDYRPFDKHYIINGEEEFKRLVLGNYIRTPTVMVRQKCYTVLGGYNEENPFPSDWEMWLRIALNYDVAFISEPLAYYRIHDESNTNRVIQMNLVGMEEYKMLKNVFLNIPPGKNHLSSLEHEAIKQAAKRILITSWENLSNGQGRLARRNLALAIAIDDSYLKDVKTYVILLATLFGKHGVFFKKLLKIFYLLKVITMEIGRRLKIYHYHNFSYSRTMNNMALNIVFTQNLDGNNELETILNEVIEHIINEIDTKEISILLIGSMSRGEASVVAKNGKVMIYSDIDLMAVVDYPERFREKLEDLSLELTEKYKEVLLSHIDIAPIAKISLKNPPKKIFFYELLNSGKVIFGDDVLQGIKIFDKREIQKNDAKQMVVNRCADLLMYIPTEKWLKNENMAKFRAYEISKGILDSCTALLAFEGQMIDSYEKRMRKFMELCNDNKAFKKRFSNLHQLIVPLTKYKLNPDFEIIRKLMDCKTDFECVENLWRESAKTLLDTYLYMHDKKSFKSNIGKLVKKHLFKKYAVNTEIIELLKHISMTYPYINEKDKHKRETVIMEWAKRFVNEKYVRKFLDGEGKI